MAGAKGSEQRLLIQHYVCAQGKEYACNAGDMGLIPGYRRPPREGNGYPLQYSCQENFMDRGISWIEFHGKLQSMGLQRIRQLSD